MSTTLANVPSKKRFNKGIFTGINDLVIPAIKRSTEAVPEAAPERSLLEITVADIEREIDERLQALPRKDRSPRLGDMD